MAQDGGEPVGLSLGLGGHVWSSHGYIRETVRACAWFAHGLNNYKEGGQVTALDWACGLSILAFLLGFPLLCEVAYQNRARNRFWWTLNRVRAAVAYEDDPGLWRDRK